jgi:hypothetical protein
MAALRIAISAFPLLLVSDISFAQFFFSQNPVTLDNLDGNYRTIAGCAYQHLVNRQSGLTRAEPRPGVIQIASTGQQWELSFINDDGGRQTRLDWTAGGYPGEFVLSTVRACAA